MGKFKDIENIICSPIDSDEKTFNTMCNVVNAEGPIIETELAKYYLYGIGCEKNEAMFLKYINKAINSDFAKAYALYGEYCCMKGDYEKGFKYLNISANKNCGDAYYYLAKKYENGVGVTADFSKTCELYKKGAMLGNISCMQMCYTYGVDFRNLSEMIYKEYTPRELCLLLKKNDMSPRTIYSFNYYSLLRYSVYDYGNDIVDLMGYITIRRYFGFYGTGSKNPNILVNVCSTGCDLGSDMCYYMMSNIFEKGIGVQKDLGIALNWAIRGVEELNSYLCMVRLIKAYYDGSLGIKDYNLARKYINLLKTNFPQKYANSNNGEYNIKEIEKQIC